PAKAPERGSRDRPPPLGLRVIGFRPKHFRRAGRHRPARRRRRSCQPHSARIGSGIVRVEVDRALKHLPRSVVLLARRMDRALTAAQDVFVSGEAAGRLDEHAADAVPWLEAALRFDRASTRAAVYIGMAYYFLGRFDSAVEAFDRALARKPGRSTQIQ